MAEKRVDPITLEILAHRIWQVADEVGITVRRVSGSVLTIDSKDMFASVCDADGNIIQAAVGVSGHAGVVGFAIRHIVETYSENPGIRDGDVFFINDPYICSVHSNDAFVATPIFYKGERVAWSITMTHLLDLGAMSPGGPQVLATEVYQEGLRYGGIKICEGGDIRKDVWDAILGMCRVPGLVGLDLRGQIAAGTVAGRRVREIIELYGVDTFKEVCSEVIKYTEAKMRARIASLPDGSWQSAVYMDNDGMSEIVRMAFLTLTKKGDYLTFDYTGTDEQAPSCMNCAEVGGVAGVFGAVAPLMAYDLPWSQGIMNTLKITIPIGTLIRSKFPAPCSMGTLGGSWFSAFAAEIAISKMLNSAEDYQDRDVTAQWGSVSGSIVFIGKTQYGRFTVLPTLDMEAAGCGAKPTSDGLDSGGNLLIPGGHCPNVETHEITIPILYLYRRQVADSGGAGKFRGGVGGEFCFILHDAPKGATMINIFGYGTEAGLNQGICGGRPGSPLRFRMVKNSDVIERLERGDFPKSIEEINGDQVELKGNKLFPVNSDDVIYYGWSGGGGYGDAIDRDPALVKKDVVEKLVSLDAARRIYGVVIDPKTLDVDSEKTEQRREEIRKSRLTAPRIGAGFNN